MKINENVSRDRTHLPSYKEAVEICEKSGKNVFYESKFELEGYNVSIFNYRLAQYMDFVQPLSEKEHINAYEMRGLTFVFNKDGSVYERYLLLAKFFNLNQVTESMYNIVKDYKIKFINNKEDGSIASFIRLPNGKVYGKSKMSFQSEQAEGITKIYERNKDIKEFVDWTLDNDISATFEYVAPHNRIVLRYLEEELILLKLRDNKTGRHINLKDHFDRLKSIKVAPFEEDKSLDELIELMGVQTDKEGCVVHAIDENDKDFFFKMKTEWYCERHGLLTNDLYREHVMVGYILEDKIDDVMAQVPEDEIEARDRINKIIDIVRRELSKKEESIIELWNEYLKMKGEVNHEHYLKKFFAQKYNKHDDFSAVMSKAKSEELKEKPKSEWSQHFKTYDDYYRVINRGDTYELAKIYIAKKCDRLETCRKWLKQVDPTFMFMNEKE